MTDLDFSLLSLVEIARYMEKVMTLSYTEKPPYHALREIFLKGLQDIGHKDDDILDFEVSLNGDVPTKPKVCLIQIHI